MKEGKKGRREGEAQRGGARNARLAGEANGHYERLTTRIEVLTHSERSKNAFIGRVHQDDYHDLFKGSTSGARHAYIALK